MTRIKKTRTPGQIGSRKESRESADQSRERKRKAKRKGLAPGSRHNTESGSGQGGGAKAAQDPRLGSKKPIALIKGEQPAAVAQQARPKAEKVTVPALELTPEQELEQLENNERLNALLDRVEAGDKLNKDDTLWLDKTLARHQQLLEQLGLLDEDDTEAGDEPDDLWNRFMDAEFDPAQYQEKKDKS
ncbi:Der GTPase-activating protein YihI [Zobellella maritima]|uniref:Der GTPase-activating protein YihI n=1 Tax=Zobellella maritima TaxID=2059725 RepID=UPI000E307246|nr:Der GTPase-activating protein YihI [Zobellella maritima]